jgi:hypothetical protein
LDHDDRWDHAPEPLKAIVVALGDAEDVDDHIGVVDHDPSGVGRALDARVQAVLLLNLLVDMIDDRAELPVVVAGADHKKVGNRALCADVEQSDLVGLLVLGEIDNPAGQACCLYGVFS